MFEVWYRHPAVRAWAIFGGLLALAAVVALLLAPVLVPIILSFVLYALLEPTTSVLARRGINRNVSAALVLAATATIVVTAFALIFPQFIGQLQRVRSQLPVLREQFGLWADRLERELERISGVAFDAQAPLAEIANMGGDWARVLVLEGSNIVLQGVVTVILLPILTFFLIRDWKGFRNRALNLLPNRQFELGWIIYHRVARQLQRYVRGVMLQCGIMALITTTGFLLIGLESALLLGATAGVVNLIPYIGPFIAMVPPTVLILAEPPVEPWLIVSAIGVVGVGQIVDNVFVVPGVLAHAVDLHPLVVIVGIIVFGNFFGLIGLLLAIPALSSANIVLRGLRQGLRAS